LPQRTRRGARHDRADSYHKNTDRHSAFGAGASTHSEKDNAMSKLSRRNLVASAATLPALAVPAVVAASAEPDPIFAAIERHRSAWVDWSTIVEREYGRGLYHDDPRYAASEAAIDTKQAFRCDRLDDLVQTYPTTIGGVVAFLKYYAETFELDETYWPDDYGDVVAGHAAAALERIARSA
jgi:hypothetical protein